jgi:membrane protease YdiL (CAAX protease family)
VCGFASLAVVAVVSVLAGGRGLHTGHTAAETFKHVRNALLAALVVSPIEETIFRGAIFGGLKKSLKWTSALVISSAIYAIVHFFQRTGSPAEIYWSSGLVVLADMSRGFVDLQQLIPAFFNLFLAGVILAEAFQRTNALFFSMGLHAGWIFWLKTYGFLTADRPGVSAVFWGSGKLIDGWFATILLSGVLVAVRKWVPERGRNES